MTMKDTVVINNRTYEISPCPFCGNKARLLHDISIGQTYSQIICEGCEAHTNKIFISTEYSSDVKVIELWNKRVDK